MIGKALDMITNYGDLDNMKQVVALIDKVRHEGRESSVCTWDICLCVFETSGMMTVMHEWQ